MSKRIQQVNELIRSIVGRIILKELDLPRDVFVTITRVSTSPDLKNSDIFLSIIPDNKTQSTFTNLKKRNKQIQAFLAKEITFKFTPKIHIKVDYTERQAAKIEDALDKLRD